MFNTTRLRSFVRKFLGFVLSLCFAAAICSSLRARDGTASRTEASIEGLAAATPAIADNSKFIARCADGKLPRVQLNFLARVSNGRTWPCVVKDVEVVQDDENWDAPIALTQLRFGSVWPRPSIPISRPSLSRAQNTTYAGCRSSCGSLFLMWSPARWRRSISLWKTIRRVRCRLGAVPVVEKDMKGRVDGLSLLEEVAPDIRLCAARYQAGRYAKEVLLGKNGGFTLPSCPTGGELIVAAPHFNFAIYYIRSVKGYDVVLPRDATYIYSNRDLVSISFRAVRPE